jgi:microcystin-dependent protein
MEKENRSGINITPRSGFNNINYVCTFPEIPAPYFSLRSVRTPNNPYYTYNLGWAVNNTTPASSFTFNPLVTPLQFQRYPADAPVPPLPGFYNLVLNKNSGGSPNDVIMGTINLQDDEMVPKSGTSITPFTWLCKERLDDKYTNKKIPLFASYNKEPSIPPTTNDFPITKYKSTENNITFIPADNGLILPGTYTLYFTDLTNTKILGSYSQLTYTGFAGQVAFFAGPKVVMDGWLLCDGAEVSKEQYSDLFAAIGIIYGTPTDTTKFTLPNLQGKFVRGFNKDTTDPVHGGKTLGATEQDDTKAQSLTMNDAGLHSHGTQDNNGTGQTEIAGEHFHDTNPPGNVCTGESGSDKVQGGGSVRVANGLNLVDLTIYNAGNHSHKILADGTHSHTISGAPTGTETKPYNITLMPYIRW